MSHKRIKPSQPSTKDQRIAELEEQLIQALKEIEKLKKQNELLHTELVRVQKVLFLQNPTCV
jgi:predicted  nucleic acid-binding Zn-ribbon protein